MIPIEPKLQAALQTAIHQIKATLIGVAARVLEIMAAAGQSAGRISERDLLLAAHLELQNNLNTLHHVFNDQLNKRINDELSPPDNNKRKPAMTDWMSLSLVDDTEVEERMFSDKIGQQISHACESELRELASYMGSLLHREYGPQLPNPIRAENLGFATYRAIEGVTKQVDSRKLLTREFGAGLAKAMPECYTKILQELRNCGVQPMVLTLRQVEGPGNQLPGLNSGYASLSSTRSVTGALDPHYPVTNFDTGEYIRRPTHGVGVHGNRGVASDISSGRAQARFNTSPNAASSVNAADAQLMSLLRQLTAAASRPLGLDMLQRAGHSTLGRGMGGATTGRASLQANDLNTMSADLHDAHISANQALASEGLTGMMAVNLIRAHREELLQASGGKLDHMVIDVVGSLFDQILSDARVPPQMARQIARLQLPVLRVALSDSTFFSSRRHPVRRFVNRVASLACAFDDFQVDPGKQFLARVRELVQEIVEGDFDQIDIYTTKLAALEAFIAEQAHNEVEQRGTATTLSNKEAELRLQQRYMLQLQGALTPVPLPDYLRNFLPQVWSQALVLAISRDGAGSDRAKRYKRVGRDLIMSVQPKGSPILRKKFLMQLPPLMKDLNEGLALIGWHETAKREFFGKLLPGHAESLKMPPQSELDHNMMAKQVEAIFNQPVPGADTLSASDPLPEIDADALAQRFSPEEAQNIGLITETAVDWSSAEHVAQAAEPTRAPAQTPIQHAVNTTATGTQNSGLGAVIHSTFEPAPETDSFVPHNPETASSTPMQPLVINLKSIPEHAAAAVIAQAASSDENNTRPAPLKAPSIETNIEITAAQPAVPAMLPGIDVDLSLIGPDPAEVSRGAALIDNLQIGFAYQMHLKEEWQKVRLAHVSAGRNFFVFTHGKTHKETISMTSRMLARMCETGRMRAIESAYLMERATQRARKQLSMLGMGQSKPA
jgi:hypothetical protein